MQEAKRQGMLRDIDLQLRAARQGRDVERTDVEQLVGRLSHTAQVAREGNAFLQPLYRLMCASHAVRVRARDRHGVVMWKRRRVRPRLVRIAGDTSSQRAYRAALSWWSSAIDKGISVPLAPRRGFPGVGEAGCAFLFTDAARETGSGYGGFTIVRESGSESPRFLYMAELWDPAALQLLRSDVLSMPAGECYGAVVLADAVARRLNGLSHLWCFTDSVATRSAITTGCSGAPQLDRLVTWLFLRHANVQFLAVHVPGVRNVTADGLSRGREGAVLAEAARAGLCSERLRPVAEAELVLRQVSLLEHRREAESAVRVS